MSRFREGTLVIANEGTEYQYVNALAVCEVIENQDEDFILVRITVSLEDDDYVGMEFEVPEEDFHIATEEELEDFDIEFPEEDCYEEDDEDLSENDYDEEEYKETMSKSKNTEFDVAERTFLAMEGREHEIEDTQDEDEYTKMEQSFKKSPPTTKSIRPSTNSKKLKNYKLGRL